MFLNLLNDEEKTIFLKLAISVIHADGKLEENEKAYIKEYSKEMGIQKYDLYEKIDRIALAEKIGKESSAKAKRIFLLELVACANADGDFADAEKKLIESFADAFGLPKKLLTTCLSLLEEYRNITSKFSLFVEEKQ